MGVQRFARCAVYIRRSWSPRNGTWPERSRVGPCVRIGLSWVLLTPPIYVLAPELQPHEPHGRSHCSCK